MSRPISTRQPSVNEGVETLLRCLTKTEPKLQLAWMRIRFGDDYADKVAAIARAEWKKRGKK